MLPPLLTMAECFELLTRNVGDSPAQWIGWRGLRFLRDGTVTRLDTGEVVPEEEASEAREGLAYFMSLPRIAPVNLPMWQPTEQWPAEKVREMFPARHGERISVDLASGPDESVWLEQKGGIPDSLYGKSDVALQAERQDALIERDLEQMSRLPMPRLAPEIIATATMLRLFP